MLGKNLLYVYFVTRTWKLPWGAEYSNLIAVDLLVPRQTLDVKRSTV